MALTNQVSNVYSVGLRNVGSYQVSGTPYITGSTVPANDEVTIAFPYVTKKIFVKNTKPTTSSKILRVHFQATGSGNVISGKHFVELGAQESVTFNVKCSNLYLTVKASGQTCDYQVYASLTNIPSARMYNLTGSGITE